MNKLSNRLLWGLLIWAVPFAVSVLVWDPATNLPRISIEWFYALMAFSFAVGLSIAICNYFRGKTKDSVGEGWQTGITWYLELIILDLIVLVGLFGMSMSEYYPMLLTYLNVVAITAAVGYIKR